MRHLVNHKPQVGGRRAIGNRWGRRNQDMAKRSIPPLRGEQISLRLLVESDLPLTVNWRNQDHVRKRFFHSALISADQHAAWFAQYWERDDDFTFVIEALEPLRPVGQVAIYHVEQDARRAEFGRLMIGESLAAGRGIARLATDLLVREALWRWGLDEIYLEVFDDNERARSIYVSCGFVEMGRRDNVILMSKFRLNGGS
jgi:RimJ/RimL family protein N-acetyltransferase